MGGRKLFRKLEPFLEEHRIKMGRDIFFELLSAHDLLIKRRRCYSVTTNSRHWMRKYPNLIRELVIAGPDQLWVSDITYWKVRDRHLYISFITDAWSRKIVGYHVAETLETVETIKALEMALKNLKAKPLDLIHHSDRGLQYCSGSYIELLSKYRITPSMTENGDPLENSIAERINGIIKNEYLFDFEAGNILEAKKLLKDVVRLYNEDRPHASIGYLTPSEVYEGPGNTEIKRLWKNYYARRQETVSCV